MKVTIYDSEALEIYSDALIADEHGDLVPAQGMPSDDDIADAIGAALMGYQDHGYVVDSVHDYVTDSIINFWTITE